MSADAQQLMDLTANLNLLWSAPLQILMAVSLLWQELGPAVLAGTAVLVLVIPINALVATRVKKLKVRKRLHPVTRVKQKPSFLTCVDNNHLANSVYVEITQLCHSFIQPISIGHLFCAEVLQWGELMSSSFHWRRRHWEMNKAQCQMLICVWRNTN